MKQSYLIATGIFLLLIIFMSGCTSKKQKEMRFRAEVEGKRPTWAKQMPINNDGYYWGVGEITIPKSAPLTSVQRERAKQNALSDIANAISVKVSTQSLLATAKVSDQLKQSFQRIVKLNSKLTLEGIELADTYRDEYAYFELYRLNQEQYHQQHKRMLQALLNQSSQWLDAVTSARSKGDYRSALLFALKTLNGLSDYWDEELYIVRGGKNVNPIAEADREINEILRQVAIRPLVSPLEVRPGEMIDATKVGFCVTGGEQGYIGYLPLKFRSEGIKLTTPTALTDERGVALLPLNISSNDLQESALIATLDLRPIVTEAAVKESIGQYISRLQLPEGKMEIQHLAPQLRIVSKTKGNTSVQIRHILCKAMEQKGVTIVESTKATTVEISVRSKTFQEKGYQTVKFDVTIRYKGKDQSELTTTQSALTEEEAILQCCESLATEIKAKVAGKIYYSFFEEQ